MKCYSAGMMEEYHILLHLQSIINDPISAISGLALKNKLLSLNVLHNERESIKSSTTEMFRCFAYWKTLASILINRKNNINSVRNFPLTWNMRHEQHKCLKEL